MCVASLGGARTTSYHSESGCQGDPGLSSIHPLSNAKDIDANQAPGRGQRPNQYPQTLPVVSLTRRIESANAGMNPSRPKAVNANTKPAGTYAKTVGNSLPTVSNP